MPGATATVLVLVIMILIVAWLIGNLIRSIQVENGRRKLWKNFGLSIGFCVLFLVSWLGQGVAQWQTFTDEARDHNESVEVGDFLSEFSQSTLENWQSEFLQLFSFTVMAALLLHVGSAESKDSDDAMQEALERIEEKLGTKPGS